MLSVEVLEPAYDVFFSLAEKNDYKNNYNCAEDHKKSQNYLRSCGVFVSVEEGILLKREKTYENILDWPYSRIFYRFFASLTLISIFLQICIFSALFSSAFVKSLALSMKTVPSCFVRQTSNVYKLTVARDF